MNSKANVLIDYDALLSVVAARDKFDIVKELVEKEVFRVSSTGLTYRQVNILDTESLLDGRTEKEQELDEMRQGWRSFDFKDLVYLRIIDELKKYGVKNEQLRSLHDAFNLGQTAQMVSNALASMFLGYEITLVFKPEGGCYLLSPLYLAFYDSEMTNDRGVSELRLRLNPIVNTILTESGNKEFEVKYSEAKHIFSQLLRGNPEQAELSKQEATVVDLIRNEDFEQITVRKKSGKPSVVHLDEYTKDVQSRKDIFELIGSKDFQDVEIKKRDGRIVYVKASTSIKL